MEVHLVWNCLHGLDVLPNVIMGGRADRNGKILLFHCSDVSERRFLTRVLMRL